MQQLQCQVRSPSLIQLALIYCCRSSVVRQAENLASNKENFNYLNGNHNQERGDTEVGADGIYTEIEPNKQENSSKTQQDVTDDSENIASNNNVTRIPPIRNP